VRARYSWPRCLAPVYRKLFTSPAGMCIFYISDFQESYGLSGGTSYGTDSDVCAPAGPSLAKHGDRAGASPLACVHASAREGGLRSGGLMRGPPSTACCPAAVATCGPMCWGASPCPRSATPSRHCDMARSRAAAHMQSDVFMQWLATNPWIRFAAGEQEEAHRGGAGGAGGGA
jgi:hypothetical protein